MSDRITPIKSPQVKLQNLGHETVCYDPVQKAVHILNPTARLIWDLCNGEHTIEEIEGIVRSSFEIPDGQDLAQDIKNTLETFSVKKLIRLEPSNSIKCSCRTAP